MAENNQKPAHSFFRFFGISIAEGWTESREKFGLAVDITLALAAFGILGLTWYSKHHGEFNEQGWEGSMNYWLAVIPVGLWVAWFIYHVMKSAHNLYLKEWEKAEKERKKHDDEKAVLQAENQSLTEKLAEKSAADKLVTDRQFAKKMLGNCLIELQARLYAAKQISQYDFVDDLRKKEWETTNRIFNAIDRHLDVLLTSAEVAFFRGARPQPLPDPERYDFMTEREQEWQWHVNFITVRKDELKRILERLG